MACACGEIITPSGACLGCLLDTAACTCPPKAAAAGSDPWDTSAVELQTGNGDEHQDHAPAAPCDDGPPHPADDPREIARHPGALDAPAPDDDADFWKADERLEAIRDWARARRMGPFGLLTEVLMRVLCRVPPSIVLPPLGNWSETDQTIGTASLNQIVALVGPPGLFKGYAQLIGSEVVEWPGWAGVPAQAPLGSGQGVAATFAASKRNKEREFEHVRLAWSALFTATEVDKVAALTQAKQSTLSATLRQLWSGEELGESNASEETRRYVPRRGYRAGVVIHAQPDRCGALLNDAEAGGGLPQRILWLPSRDPAIPDMAPPAPERLKWHPPKEVGYAAKELGRVWERDPNEIAGMTPVILPVSGSALADIDAAAVARHRGQVGALDGHALMVREKLAATLALWLGHFGIADEHWQLAGYLVAKSDATRGAVMDMMHAAMERENTARGIQEAGRARIVADAAERDKLRQAQDRIIAVLMKNPGWWSHGKLRSMAGPKYRLDFDEAIEWLSEHGRIRSQPTTKGHGADSTEHALAGPE